MEVLSRVDGKLGTGHALSTGDSVMNIATYGR